MSRIGKQPVALPEKVSAQVNDRTIRVKGPKGELSIALPETLSAKVEGKQVVVSRANDDRFVRALHGLNRNLVANMVAGVQSGFVKELEISGVGYKAEKEGRTVLLSVGFPKPVRFEVPDGVEVDVDEKKVKLTVRGIDKQLVGSVAATLRNVRPPDPYKAKGIKYVGEVVRRKAGKAGVTAAGAGGGA